MVYAMTIYSDNESYCEGLEDYSTGETIRIDNEELPYESRIYDIVDVLLKAGAVITLSIVDK